VRARINRQPRYQTWEFPAFAGKWARGRNRSRTAGNKSSGPRGFSATNLDPISGVMHLDLTDEEAAALTRELHDIVANDRYPFSPRIRTLRTILAKLRPEPAREPLRPAQGLCATASHRRQKATAGLAMPTVEENERRFEDMGLTRVRILLNTGGLVQPMIHDAVNWAARRAEEERQRETASEVEVKRIARNTLIAAMGAAILVACLAWLFPRT